MIGNQANEISGRDVQIGAQVAEQELGPATSTVLPPPAAPDVVNQTIINTSNSLLVGTRGARASASTQRLNSEYFETDTLYHYYWDGSKWLYSGGVARGTDAARAALTISALDNGALWYASDTGKLWQVQAGAWVDLFTTIDVTTSYFVHGTKVVGRQGNAVNDVGAADAVDLPSVIALANETKQQFNSWLAEARAGSGHGLIP